MESFLGLDLSKNYSFFTVPAAFFIATFPHAYTISSASKGTYDNANPRSHKTTIDKCDHLDKAASSLSYPISHPPLTPLPGEAVSPTSKVLHRKRLRDPRLLCLWNCSRKLRRRFNAHSQHLGPRLRRQPSRVQLRLPMAADQPTVGVGAQRGVDGEHRAYCHIVDKGWKQDVAGLSWSHV
ncbi:hypothetical protein FSARC_11296 [Fusarium sarcochroum]|uniref:Uncharacterized protein n=1 Tax=Fusarium sarcochroum TaxID=1208366 RepID=A0A8H4X169_9HYPO|nr:hypothetical protein FSARC_11296 [Fusarium sarcochroum]